MFMFPFFLAVIAGITILIIWGTGTLSPNLRSQKVSENNALDILKERYARGEISKSDFERMKNDIA